MCGIAGAIGHIDPAVIDGVRRASACQRLRGPDSDGEWSSLGAESAGRGAFLAFRRLAIIDLSPDSDQPMVDPHTGNVLVFNGEIYNFREVRHELESLGDRFTSKGDGEVILRAYARWGDACLSRLRGMFGFAIWDASRRRALVARDRLGIKPLYYCEAAPDGGGKTVVFASTLRALLTSRFVERRLDAAGLSSYLWNGFVVGPGTIVQGVRLLPGGAALDIGVDGSVREFRYWTLPAACAPVVKPGEVEERLREAVRQHLISDVPLGVFLSGGKDSSAVAALASEAAGGGLRTFTITFDEPEYDESAYARRVAEALRTDHREVRLTERTFTEQLEAALGGIDQPTFDAINTYLVSRAVREAGITVAVAGTGGDELFGGYRSFRDLPVARRWSRRLAFVPEGISRSGANALARAKARSLASFPPQTRWGRLADALETRGDLVGLYQVAYGLFTSDVARRLQREHANGSVHRGLPVARARELERLVAGRPELHAISALEVQLFLGERLLRDTDAASMEVSLEVRVPLLDHQVVEALFALDEASRFEPVRSKALLSRIGLRDLPPEIFDRPKRGFELPLDRWCREGLRERVGAALLDAERCTAAGLDAGSVARLWKAFAGGVPGLYWSRVWAIYVLLWWCDRHGVHA